MSRRLLKILLLASAVCLLALMLLVWYMQAAPRFSVGPPLGGLQSPGIAMQFVRTAEKAREILPLQSDRTEMAHLQRIDFLLIGVYWVLYVVLSGVLMQRSVPGAAALASLACFCGTLAAWFDICEDRAILHAITVLDSVTDDVIARVSHYSQLKWRMVFAAFMILSLVFFSRRDLKTWTGKLSTLVGLCLLAPGLVGLVGLFYPFYLPIALSAMALGSLIASGLLLLASDKFIEGGHFQTRTRDAPHSDRS